MARESAVQVGIRFLDNVGTPRELVELAVTAEHAGFDSVWFPHDMFRQSSFPLVAAVAERTERIQLGLRNNFYTTDVSELASFIATLDHLSNGRVLPGVGLHTTAMLKWIGLEAGDPLRRTREAVSLLRQLLSGGNAEFQGQEYRWTSEAFMRMELPRREMPIYVAPFGPEYMELTGEIGDGSIPMITPPESAVEVVSYIANGALRAGRDLSAIDIVGFVWLGLQQDPDDRMGDRMADIVAYFGAYLDDFALSSVNLTKSDFAEIQAALRFNDGAKARSLVTPDMLRLGILGDSDECLARLSTVVRAGVHHICIGGPLGRDPLSAIAQMGETILPGLHGLVV